MIAQAPDRERPTDRSRDLLVVTIDLASAVTGTWACDALRAAFGAGRAAAALFPLLALVCLCVAIALARRLPHDRRAFAPDPSIARPGSLVAISTLLGTVMLLVAIGHLGFSGGGSSSSVPGWVGWLLSLVVAGALFTPVALLWVGRPRTITGRGRRLRAEALLLSASNVTALILVSYFEWLILDVRGLGQRLPPVALAGLVILVPTFLLLCGAPRLLLLARRFSWIGLLSLLASTTWYFVEGFFLAGAGA
jgi:hypothetical protein